jgi:flagellar protein FlbD
MIELTRLNGNRIAVNCDLIRYAESSPDTVLTLVTGEKLLVRETAREVAAMAFAHRASLLRTAWPEAAAALVARAACSPESNDAAAMTESL